MRELESNEGAERCDMPSCMGEWRCDILGQVCTNVTHTHARRKVGGPTPRFDGKRASRAEAASAGPSNLPAGLYGELIATFLQKEEVVIVKMKVEVKSDENRIRVTWES